MSWEPNTEENETRKTRDNLEDLRQAQFFNTSSINSASMTNSMGTSSNMSGFNFDVVGDIVEGITNSVNGGLGELYKILSGYVFITPDASESNNTAVVNKIGNGTGNTVDKDNLPQDGQLLTLRPEAGKSLKLINSVKTALSSAGNLLLGSDITLTESESITLRYQNEILFADAISGVSEKIGGWIVHSTGNGAGSSGGSNTIKSPCKIASTANQSTSGIYKVQDGVTLVQDNRVLYKDQTTASENGIYVCTGISGVVASMSRASDMSTGSTIEGGTMVYVTDGTVNGDNLFGLTTEGTVTVGTGNQAWVNLTAGGANKTLSNLTSPTSVNQSLIPDGDEVEDLGTTSNVWRRLYAKDIYSTGTIRTEASDDELEFYAGGAKSFAISRSSSSPFTGVAEVWGAGASFKTMSNNVGAVNAEIGGLHFDGYDSAVNRDTFASMTAVSTTVNSGFEDALVKVKVKRAGTTKEMLEINTIGIRLPTASLANPSDNGTIFLSGSDVKIRSGGNNVNISTIGTDILPLSNVFTGSVNTFSNASGTFQASTPTVNLGTGSGNINILGTANLTGTLDMNDNMITDITLAGIVDTGSTSRGSISGDSTKGLVINGALTTMVDVTTDIATFAKHNSGDIDFYADLDMHTYDIVSLDRLKFSTTQGSGSALGTSDTGIEATYSGGSSYGMKLVVPTNNIYQMFIGSSEKVTITTSATVLNNPVTIGGSVTIGDNYMEYGDMISSSVGSTPANKRRVFSNSQNNDELSVKKSDGSVVSLESGGASLTGNNIFTGINQFTNASTFNATSANVNLGSSASGSLVTVLGRLALYNINTAPTVTGQFTRDGNDVKVYTGGVVKNLTDIGTGGGASLSANQTFTGSNTFSGTTTQISGTAFNATVPSVSLGTSGGSISFVVQASCKNLVPSINNTYDLGVSGLQWRNLYIDGTAYLDSIAFGSQSMTLPVNNGTNGQVLTTNGSSSLSWTTPSSGSSGANTTLSNLSGGGTSINADMIPDISASRNLGGSSKYWGSGFISNSLYFGSGTSKKIQSSATNDISITVPSNGDIKFIESTTEFFRCDGGANTTIFNRDVTMAGGNVFRSNTSDEIGFMVTNSTMTTGTEGTVQIPFKSTFAGSRSATDTDFGNQRSCIGIMESAGTPYLMVKSSNGGWYGIGLTLFYS